LCPSSGALKTVIAATVVCHAVIYKVTYKQMLHVIQVVKWYTVVGLQT